MTAFADRMHAVSWAFARRTSLGNRVFHDASLRSSLLATVHVLAATLLVWVAPLPVMLLAPLLLGVPHIASDLRHLVLHPDRRASPLALAAVGTVFLMMTTVRLWGMVGGPSYPTIELLLGASAIGLASLLARGAPSRVVIVGCAVCLLGFAALSVPRSLALLIGHAHNFVAVAMWWWITRSHASKPIFLVSLALGIGAMLLLPIVPLGSFGGLSFGGLVETLAPGAGPWGYRVVLVFALMQAVHYSLWVWCIPIADGTTEPAPPTVRVLTWWRDLGPTLAVLFVLGSILLPLLGWFAPTAARSGYLSLVLFHGWLELAVAAYWFSRNDG